MAVVGLEDGDRQPRVGEDVGRDEAVLALLRSRLRHRHGLIVSTVVWTKTGAGSPPAWPRTRSRSPRRPSGSGPCSRIRSTSTTGWWARRTFAMRTRAGRAVGSKLHHSTGVGPLTVDDETAVGGRRATDAAGAARARSARPARFGSHSSCEPLLRARPCGCTRKRSRASPIMCLAPIRRSTYGTTSRSSGSRGSPKELEQPVVEPARVLHGVTGAAQHEPLGAAAPARARPRPPRTPPRGRR